MAKHVKNPCNNTAVLSRISGPAALFAALVLTAGCASYKLEQKLPAKYSDFLSQAGYIMSNTERKTFLELPDSEKDAFIEEFWRQRDPDPTTPENEYRKEYESRVARTVQLFRGEGRPGWLTDRGRIYILFGPPSERLTYPVDAGGRCREIWYYGNFPVIFLDDFCSGHYTLTAINLEHLQDLNIAQGYFQNVRQPQPKPFEYTLEVEQGEVEAGKARGKFRITFPYAEIWFSLKEGRLEAAYEVSAEIRGRDRKTAWSYSHTFPVQADENELKANRNKTFVIEVPFELDAAEFSGQELTLQVSIKNPTESIEHRKTEKFRLKS
jgi:GWxTD domain-containing protein